MSKLAVVILNWNGRKFLEQFLPTLVARTPAWAEIVVADNASTDDSLAFLQAQYPAVRRIVLDKNYGFARGYNLALAQIEATYYCLLNSDIEVGENWVEPIIAQLDMHPEVAAVQPKIRSFYARDTFEYAGAAGGFLDRYGYPFCRGRVFNHVEADRGQYEASMDIFWATGAALFVRSSVYRALGGLDDDFFAHMEEIDLCWRMRNHGYRIVVEPQSVVYHVGGGTLPKNNAWKTYLNFRNNHFLLIKNLPRSRWFGTFCVRLLLDNVAAVAFLLQGNAKDFCAVYKAHGSVFKHFNYYKKKRTGQPFAAFPLLWRTPLLIEYYVKGHHFFDGQKFNS